jgi:hypothetical protein
MIFPSIGKYSSLSGGKHFPLNLDFSGIILPTIREYICFFFDPYSEKSARRKLVKRSCSLVQSLCGIHGSIEFHPYPSAMIMRHLRRGSSRARAKRRWQNASVFSDSSSSLPRMKRSFLVVPLVWKLPCYRVDEPWFSYGRHDNDPKWETADSLDPCG